MIRKFIPIFCAVIIWSACRNEPTNIQTFKDSAGTEDRNVQLSAVSYDSTTTAIIPWRFNYAFDSLEHRPARLTGADIQEIEKSLLATIENYNTSLKNESYKIDWSGDYKKQLVAVVNSNGDKEVWVNCFCRNGGDTWRTDIVVVFDGGPCYFNFKINLTTKKVYDLMVNGVA